MLSTIVTISASARHGKDTFAGFLKDSLEAQGKKVIIFHYADFLKYIASNWFNWDGKKDDKGRTLLQYLGTDVFRKNRPNCWVNMAKEFVLGMGDLVDFVLIPDCRFPNEIEIWNESGFNIKTIKVIRPDFDNGLSESQKAHPSETSLNNWIFDYNIINSGTLEDLKGKSDVLAKTLING